jgi:hypothetical protein
MPTEIVNCAWKFQFQCPRQWAGLRKTADPKVRLCEACLRDVHWCDNDTEVRRRAAEGACVAVAIADEDDDLEGALLGRVLPSE